VRCTSLYVPQRTRLVPRSMAGLTTTCCHRPRQVVPPARYVVQSVLPFSRKSPSIDVTYESPSSRSSQQFRTIPIFPASSEYANTTTSSCLNPLSSQHLALLLDGTGKRATRIPRLCLLILLPICPTRLGDAQESWTVASCC
jgi:hypothetical protein